MSAEIAGTAPPEERRTTHAQSISLDILLKALPTVVIAEGLSAFGVKAVVVAAVLGPLLAEGAKQLVARRQWGPRRTLALGGVLLVFVQFDSYVARALRRLLGGRLSDVATSVHSGVTTVAVTCTAATGISLAVVVPPTVMDSTPQTPLIANGDAEGSRGVSEYEVAKPADWKTTGRFTTAAYDAFDYDSPAARAVGGGKHFFAGGPDAERSTAIQVVDLSRFADAVDAGREQADLSAALGGWAFQDDHATVTASFLDAGGRVLGEIRIGPVTAKERGEETKLLDRRASAPVPVHTRRVRILVVATRLEGAYNDGYADNIRLSVRPRH